MPARIASAMSRFWILGFINFIFRRRRGDETQIILFVFKLEPPYVGSYHIYFAGVAVGVGVGVAGAT